MRNSSLSQLRKELRQSGAGPAETAELSAIAAKLPLLREHKPRRQPRFLKLAAGGVIGLAAGVFLVLSAQSALPTSWLYPVQKFSDNVAVTLHPGYRATIMMKRAGQVNSLVAAHAGSNKVLATLADYTSQAAAYKTMPHTNYSAFEFCKTNLQQAAATAPPAERQAIETSLRSLGTS